MGKYSILDIINWALHKTDAEIAEHIEQLSAEAEKLPLGADKAYLEAWVTSLKSYLRARQQPKA